MIGRNRFDYRSLLIMLAPLIVAIFIIYTIFPVMEKAKFVGDIDQEFLESIEGDYYVEWNDEIEAQFGEGYEGYWDLHIDGRPYFACIDGEAGNPGFEGEIVKLGDGQISIKMNRELYEGMPLDWKPANRNYIVLDISKNGDDLELTCSKQTLTFRRAE